MALPFWHLGHLTVPDWEAEVPAVDADFCDMSVNL